MSSITIEEAQAQLQQIIRQLAPGDELVITENDQPIAKLARTSAAGLHPRQPGSAKGQIWMSPDFDAPLEDFKEYME